MNAIRFRYGPVPTLLLSALLSCLWIQLSAQQQGRLLFEIKIYHIRTDAQRQVTEHYLETAELPALHRLGIRPVGVFEPVTPEDSDFRIYELIPFRSFSGFESLPGKLRLDKQYRSDGAQYLDAPYNDPAYARMEVILLRAFPKMPGIRVPSLTAPKSSRVYELRSYENSSEQYNLNKVKMFNLGGEISLFKRLNFNAVFYAEVLSGARMPNLMYLTTFENKADRDTHWNAFSNDPQWKALSSSDQYQHNVIRADILFLRPLDFSDL